MEIDRLGFSRCVSFAGRSPNRLETTLEDCWIGLNFGRSQSLSQLDFRAGNYGTLRNWQRATTWVVTLLT